MQVLRHDAREDNPFLGCLGSSEWRGEIVPEGDGLHEVGDASERISVTNIGGPVNINFPLVQPSFQISLSQQEPIPGQRSGFFGTVEDEGYRLEPNGIRDVLPPDLSKSLINRGDSNTSTNQIVSAFPVEYRQESQKDIYCNELHSETTESGRFQPLEDHQSFLPSVPNPNFRSTSAINISAPQPTTSEPRAAKLPSPSLHFKYDQPKKTSSLPASR